MQLSEMIKIGQAALDWDGDMPVRVVFTTPDGPQTFLELTAGPTASDPIGKADSFMILINHP